MAEESKALLELLQQPLTGDMDFIPTSEFIYETGNLGIPMEKLKQLHSYNAKQFHLKQTQLDSSLIILLINPENYTALNYRKTLLKSKEIDGLKEFELISLSLSKHPRQPLLWSHLRYVLNFYKIDSDKLHKLTYKCCDRYRSNYPAWAFKRHLLNGPLDDIFAEFKLNTVFVRSHVSDYSGFSFRQYLLRLMPIDRAILGEEIAWLLEVFCMYPGHECLWYHLQHVCTIYITNGWQLGFLDQLQPFEGQLFYQRFQKAIIRARFLINL
jgi:hypothetical protein